MEWGCSPSRRPILLKASGVTDSAGIGRKHHSRSRQGQCHGNTVAESLSRSSSIRSKPVLSRSTLTQDQGDPRLSGTILERSLLSSSGVPSANSAMGHLVMSLYSLLRIFVSLNPLLHCARLVFGFIRLARIFTILSTPLKSHWTMTLASSNMV